MLGFPQNNIPDFCTEECLDSLYSGRGEYVFPKEPAHCRTDCRVIEYARKNGFSRFDDGLDFAPLQEVVIIGHGLEADCRK